jgi:hypothetical protein
VAFPQLSLVERATSRAPDPGSLIGPGGRGIEGSCHFSSASAIGLGRLAQILAAGRGRRVSQAPRRDLRSVQRDPRYQLRLSYANSVAKIQAALDAIKSVLG